MNEGYQLVLGYSGVRRLSDRRLIPVEHGNEDWAEYCRWLNGGGQVEPADEGWTGPTNDPPAPA